MKVTISTLSDEIFVLDVSEDLELENFKAFCQVESGCNAQDIILIFNGRPLMDGKKTLKDEGVADGDVIVLQTLVQPVAPPRIQAPEVPNVNPSIAQLDFSSIRVPDAMAGPSTGAGLPAGAPRPPPLAEDPKTVHDMLAANPDQLSLLRQNNPRLADAYMSGNFDTFATVLKEQVEARVEKEKQRLRMLNSDPFDTEAQRLIAEEIRQNNIEANMEAAMEHLPETFGTVAMLYINCHVNGYPVKAFIDSGAQTTIMSAGCAERCNIMRLVDTRWAGIAKGVGVQRIIGRIHMVQIKIENDFLTSSFAVLQDQPMDMLLGLDMLRRHQCNIDLNENVLRIGTTGTVSRFLPESELPECARLSGSSEQQLDEDTARVRQQLEVQDRLNNAKKENS